jgi:hypothetical protein
LKSALSKAIQERRAACSAAVVMLYWAKEEMSGATASEAVAHSPAMGALAHEAEVGAMDSSCETGSAWRGRRCGGDGIADVRDRRVRIFRVVRYMVEEYVGGCRSIEFVRRKIRKGRSVFEWEVAGARIFGILCVKLC